MKDAIKVTFQEFISPSAQMAKWVKHSNPHILMIAMWCSFSFLMALVPLSGWTGLLTHFFHQVIAMSAFVFLATKFARWKWADDLAADIKTGEVATDEYCRADWVSLCEDEIEFDFYDHMTVEVEYKKADAALEWIEKRVISSSWAYLVTDIGQVKFFFTCKQEAMWFKLAFG